MTERPSRRRLLGAIGAGFAATVAGCGYRPGEGELDWRTEIVKPFGPTLSSSTGWRSDGEILCNVLEDGWVAAYDRRGDVAWSGVAEIEGTDDVGPVRAFAVDAGTVSLLTEDGRVIALEGDPDDSGSDDRGTTGWERYGADARTRWSSVIGRGDGDDAGGGNDTGDGDGADDGDSAADGDDAGDGSDDRRLVAGSELVVAGHRGLVGFDADDGDERFEIGSDGFGGEPIVAVAIGSDGVWAIAGGSENGDFSEPTLYGLSTDGTVRATRPLPTRPGWLEAFGSEAVLGFDDELRVIDADGDRRASVPLETTGDEPLVVPTADRLYQYSRTTLEAVDVAAGERVWTQSIDLFYHGPVACADGVYGVSGNPRTIDGCRLFGVSADDGRQWTARPPTDLACGDECFLVDDRLVVRATDELYGFRTTEGSRQTVL